MLNMVHPWKHPKSGIYYLRKAIPEDLRDAFGKHEFKISLKTRTPSEAKALFAIELARVETLIATQRGLKVRPAISKRQAMMLARDWLQDALNQDLIAREKREYPETESRLSAKETSYTDEEDSSDLAYDLELSFLDESHNSKDKELWVAVDIQEALEKRGLIAPDKKSDEYKDLLDAFHIAKTKYYQTLQKRAMHGWAQFKLDPIFPDFDEPFEIAPGTASAPLKASSGVTLGTLFDKWKAENAPTQKTEEDYRSTIEKFEVLNGTPAIDKIDKAMVRAFKEFLMNKGNSPDTINKKINALSAVLGYASNNGYITENPTVGMRIKKKPHAQEGRKPFSNEDLKQIFQSEIFTKKTRPRGGAGEAAYWLPLLAYYTGARLEEIGQLHAEDIQEHNGVHYMEITDLGSGSSNVSKKSVKTKTSRRIVPLHNDLIDLGFISYTRAQKGKQLFPDLKPNRHGQKTQYWSKWWGRYRKETLGITDPDKVFHSFRHTFIQKLRAVVTEDAHLRALTGHTDPSKDAHLGYGLWSSPRGQQYPYAPDTLYRAICQLDGIPRSVIEISG